MALFPALFRIRHVTSTLQGNDAIFFWKHCLVTQKLLVKSKKETVVVTCGNHSGIRHIVASFKQRQCMDSSADSMPICLIKKETVDFVIPDPESFERHRPMQVLSGKPYFSRGIFTIRASVATSDRVKKKYQAV